MPIQMNFPSMNGMYGDRYEERNERLRALGYRLPTGEPITGRPVRTRSKVLPSSIACRAAS